MACKRIEKMNIDHTRHANKDMVIRNLAEIIYDNYRDSIEQTLTDSDRISIVDEDETGVDKLMSWIESASGTVVDYVTGLLSRFIEAVAVMIVTSCLLPILVLFFIAWLIRLLFNTDMTSFIPSDFHYKK